MDDQSPSTYFPPLAVTVPASN